MSQEDFSLVSLLLMGGAVVFLYASAASMLIGLMGKPIVKSISPKFFNGQLWNACARALSWAT
jgi:hypothetical protein